MCVGLWRRRETLWAEWAPMFWVMVVPHLLLLKIIGPMEVVYLSTEFHCARPFTSHRGGMNSLTDSASQARRRRTTVRIRAQTSRKRRTVMRGSTPARGPARVQGKGLMRTRSE